MRDIDNQLDDYFYPQSKILKQFGVPIELFMFNLVDGRMYQWIFDKEADTISLGNLQDKKTFIIKEILPAKKMFPYINVKDQYSEIRRHTQLKNIILVFVDLSDRYGLGNIYFEILNGNNEIIRNNEGEFLLKEKSLYSRIGF